MVSMGRNNFTVVDPRTLGPITGAQPDPARLFNPRRQPVSPHLVLIALDGQHVGNVANPGAVGAGKAERMAVSMGPRLVQPSQIVPPCDTLKPPPHPDASILPIIGLHVGVWDRPRLPQV